VDSERRAGRQRHFRRVVGLSLAATSAGLWALGGIAAQELFSRHHVDPGWLAGVRLARDTGARPTTAWGLSIGAIPMLVWFPPWAAHPSGAPWSSPA
jgi:hypothetical protein